MRMDAGSRATPRARTPAWLRRSARSLGILAVLTALVVGTAAAPAGAAPADSADTTFLVALRENGDARVTLRLAFDTSTEPQRRALERLKANRSDAVGEFHSGLAAVAANVEAETGRSTSVGEPAMRVTTGDSTGLVEIAVTWRGLAAVEGDRLRVAAPFDDGFRPPGRFVIRAPEGYAIAGVSPSPATESGTEAAWEAGTSLSGFEATFAPAETVGEAPPQSTPGFGLLVGALALALLSGLLALTAGRRS